MMLEAMERTSVASEVGLATGSTAKTAKTSYWLHPDTLESVVGTNSSAATDAGHQSLANVP